MTAEWIDHVRSGSHLSERASSPSVRFLNREFRTKNVVVRSRGERRAVKSSVIDRAHLQIGLRVEATGIFRIYLWTTVGSYGQLRTRGEGINPGKEVEKGVEITSSRIATIGRNRVGEYLCREGKNCSIQLSDRDLLFPFIASADRTGQRILLFISNNR